MDQTSIKTLDDEFVNYMLQIEERYQKYLTHSEASQVEKWSKVLCQMVPVENLGLRQNRNLYVILLLDMILSKCSIKGIFGK